MEFLTHYFRKGDPPFRSLSSLADEQAIAIATSFQHETAMVYRRFKDPEKYWRERKRTESWVRQEFIKKGGKPITPFPQYMVIGSSLFISEGYEGNCYEIQVPLAEFQRSEVSFTYPDSMVSLMLFEERSGEEYFQPEYHGKVFTLDEIGGVVKSFGIPEREWEEKPKRKYDFFIEAQVWSERVVSKYRTHTQLPKKIAVR